MFMVGAAYSRIGLGTLASHAKRTKNLIREEHPNGSILKLDSFLGFSQDLG